MTINPNDEGPRPLVEEAGWESFPASDPPPWTLGREPVRSVWRTPTTWGRALLLALLLAGLGLVTLTRSNLALAALPLGIVLLFPAIRWIGKVRSRRANG